MERGAITIKLKLNITNSVMGYTFIVGYIEYMSIYVVR